MADSGTADGTGRGTDSCSIMTQTSPGNTAGRSPAHSPDELTCILIIESYFEPYTVIAEKLFPQAVGQFKYIAKSCLLENVTDRYYYTRAELPASEIGYYFNKIYYVENDKIVAINKAARQIMYYDKETGRPITFSRVEREETVNKTAYMPQLRAQEGEHVIFPEDDEDEEL